MTIWYILAGLAIWAVIAAIIIATGKRERTPFRVGRTAAGKFIVQEYRCLTPDWVCVDGADPRHDPREYGWVTLCAFDTLEEAMAVYGRYMDSFRQAELSRKAGEERERAERRRKELEETVDKVYK